jgi:phosphoglycolate phosphatase
MDNLPEEECPITESLKLIIFDLDGTLVDSKKDIAQATNHTLKTLGRSPLKEEVIYQFVGEGVRRLLQQCLGDGNQQLIEEAWQIFGSYYSLHLLDNTVLFPQVKETLESLWFLDKIIISNKPDRFCFPILEGLSIISYFKMVLGGDSLSHRKPDPSSIHSIMEAFGLNNKQLMMVGDSGIDLEYGKRAGIFTCGVTYGFRSKDELIEKRPDFLIDRFEELKFILKRFFGYDI